MATFMQILIVMLLVAHVIVSLLMVLVVLMQRPKNEGLGAAFGGGMTDNLFGAQTTNVLQKFTVYLGGAFFALTLALAILYARQTSYSTFSAVDKGLEKVPAPVIATPTPDPAAATPVPENGAAPAPAVEGSTTPAPAPAVESAATPAPATSPEATATPAPATESAPAPAATPAEAAPAATPQ